MCMVLYVNLKNNLHLEKKVQLDFDHVFFYGPSNCYFYFINWQKDLGGYSPE